MRKMWLHKAIICFLLGCMEIVTLVGCGASNEKRSVSGSYHTEADGAKRGKDIDLAMEGNTITAIVVNATDAEYSLTDPNAFQMQWAIKQTVILQELQNMGVDGVNGIKVELDEQGIPTSIENFNMDVVPDGCIDCAGMLILAVQDALSK